MNRIFGNTKLIDDIAQLTIDKSFSMHNIKSSRSYPEGRETIASITNSRPVRIWPTKSSWTFRLTSITDDNLKKAGSVMI
jgi:hypothetical protein